MGSSRAEIISPPLPPSLSLTTSHPPTPLCAPRPTGAVGHTTPENLIPGVGGREGVSAVWFPCLASSRLHGSRQEPHLSAFDGVYVSPLKSPPQEELLLPLPRYAVVLPSFSSDPAPYSRALVDSRRAMRQLGLQVPARSLHKSGLPFLWLCFLTKLPPVHLRLRPTLPNAENFRFIPPKFARSR